MNFKNKKVAILGFEINGIDATEFLLKQGANITVYDRKTKKELELKEFDKKGVEFVLGPDYLKNGLKNFDYIFRSPAVYPYIPELIEAKKSEVEITSPIKLFFDLCPAKIIGVTGTKGKGTTCTLIYEILKKAGKDVCLAGNIGKPVLELLPKLTKNSFVVLELSSFQLIDMIKSPHIAVVLNITTDHMDWHKDRGEYIEAKTQIVRHQKNNDYAILNYDYTDSLSFARLSAAKKYYFSRSKKIIGSYVKNGKIILEVDGKNFQVGDTQKLLLRGEHNWENVCAASLASYLAGSDVDSIKQTIFSFKGLEHRLELVGKFNNVSFYNDSFSTNPQTTIAAIQSFKEPTTLILGGSDKGLDYDNLGKIITKSVSINAIVLIGLISGIIKKAILKSGYKGKLIELGSPKMSEIVKKCFELTPESGVVLLSPATASFDMFKDYKDRGNQFKKEVMKLPLS
jgi:UDP-N-acetylmuramoylalanine--D-glutamate ligase